MCPERGEVEFRAVSIHSSQTEQCPLGWQWSTDTEDSSHQGRKSTSLSHSQSSIQKGRLGRSQESLLVNSSDWHSVTDAQWLTATLHYTTGTSSDSRHYGRTANEQNEFHTTSSILGQNGPFTHPTNSCSMQEVRLESTATSKVTNMRKLVVNILVIHIESERGTDRGHRDRVHTQNHSESQHTPSPMCVRTCCYNNHQDHFQCFVLYCEMYMHKHASTVYTLES